MSSFLNRVITLPEKPVSKHPWESRMKPENFGSMKYAHNSITSNLKYPKLPKLTLVKTDEQKKLKKNVETNKAKDLFTVIGVKFSEEFIYCRHWVKVLRRYRSKSYEEPVITGVTSVEWPKVSNDLKLKHIAAYCVDSPVVVLLNGVYLGGHEQLKEHLERIFTYNFHLDYRKESIIEFSNFLNSTNRPFVFMHFSVDDKPLGTMIFMLYTDIVPITCENFMRLCRETRGGYAGTPVHRIVKDCWIQCGGFGLKDTDMNCENFILDFDKRGVLGMANADRHVDCSTQFFVISQPAHWMKEQYVAFGQLIDGESTFKAIEDSPTWYESPTQDIKIYKAGIINLECQYPMTINKSTREYVTNHIENLHELAEYLNELIMENVSNAILLNYLKSLERANAEDGEEQTAEVETRVRAVDRFVHKSNTHTAVEAEENNEFDVDSYVYEPEEYIFDHVSVSPNPTIKPDIPFYMALTDVPYPGEVDSDFDMKRFIKGEYSLQNDVQQNVPRIYLRTTAREDSGLLENSGTSSSEESSLGSEGRRELDNYLKKMGEKVCYSGDTVKKIAKSLTTENMLKYFYSNKNVAPFSDEELRKARRLDRDMKLSKQRQFSRLVSITVDEEHTGHRIRRRPTGFLREEDVLKMIRARIKAGVEPIDDDSSDDSDLSFLGSSHTTKKTKVHIPNSKTKEAKPSKKYYPDSTLHRLYSDIGMSEGENPTLKDFRSAGSRDNKPPPLFLTISEKVQISEDSVDHNKTLKQEKTQQSMHKRMMEAKAVENIDEKRKSFVRRRHYAKMRPRLTVQQYHKKNRTSVDGVASMENDIDFPSTQIKVQHFHPVSEKGRSSVD